MRSDNYCAFSRNPEEEQQLALAALEQLGVAHATIEPETGRIEVRISAAARELPEIVSGFARAGIGLAGLSVHEPTLDDVFFALTEHSATSTREES